MIETHDLFTHGGNSEIYRVNPTEKRVYPRADLVRLASNYGDEMYGLRTFCSMRLGGLLYPQNFIGVEAYRPKRIDQKKNPLQNLLMAIAENLTSANLDAVWGNRSAIYSRLANVPPAHAVYTRHVKRREPDNCATCREHELFHKEHHLAKRAAGFAKQTAAAGITIPAGDITDYCLDPATNQPVFFEVDRIDPDIMEAYLLKKQKDKKMIANEQVALNYLHKCRFLFDSIDYTRFPNTIIAE